ncbi:MAG: hypothetical protein KIS61_22165 [Candidatus Eremiobacteraeota bacterium]|nr:hypothetical protein [Candidatus Eremiobacteraeota bacterium]
MHFLLIIEMGQCLCILRRHAQISDSFLSSASEPYSYKNLGGVVVSGEVKFERLSLKGMGMGRNSVRRRSVEGADLRASFSTYGIHRSIPSNFRVRSSQVYTVSPGSARISQRDSRKTLLEIISWAKRTGDEIAMGEKNYDGSFLAHFCRPVPFSEMPAELMPTSIMIDAASLEDYLTDDSNTPDIRVMRKGSESQLSAETAFRILDKLGTVLTVDGDVISYRPDKGKELALGSLKRLKNGFSIKSKLLAKYHISGREGTAKLERWINQNQSFTVVFNRPSFAYVDGSLFEDGKLLGSIPGLLDMVETWDGLKGLSDEKDVTATGFGANGIFKLVEDKAAADSILVCDDLGDEWADYIEFSGGSRPRLVFYHCKHGKESTSASKFQEIIGQALKNLSRMHSDPGDFDRKWRNKWQKNYDKAFPRLRKGDKALTKQTIKSTVASDRATKEVALVVNFLSKAALKRQLGLLKQGKAKPHVAQLLWLLSGFVAGCKQHSVLGRILCCP